MKFANVHAISLCADQSLLTMIANDYGYDKVFTWQVESVGAEGDIMVCLSTSGLSKNVVGAARTVNPDNYRKGMTIISIIGQNGTGGELQELSDIALIIPNLSHPMPLEDVQSAICHMITMEVSIIRGVWDC